MSHATSGCQKQHMAGNLGRKMGMGRQSLSCGPEATLTGYDMSWNSNPAASLLLLDDLTKYEFKKKGLLPVTLKPDVRSGSQSPSGRRKKSGDAPPA